MPGGDRTGPMGIGPMTGRSAGYCVGFGMPGYANPMPGCGSGIAFGRGRGSWGFGGGGRGWRHWFYATGQPGWLRFGSYAMPHGYPMPYQQPDPETEKKVLKNQADALQSELDFIKKCLDEIETRTAAE
ncbi:MAG: DUF5320 domain-containing protein [Candidatus Eisenbacteria bacterium]|nr:DUF5320 domain-containing protein [Candidatus Eisenbacteria bacterium]